MLYITSQERLDQAVRDRVKVLREQSQATIKRADLIELVSYYQHLPPEIKTLISEEGFINRIKNELPPPKQS